MSGWDEVSTVAPRPYMVAHYFDPVFESWQRVESTMFRDVNNSLISTGNVVRAAVTGNTDLHGAWVDYLVSKGPGGFVFRYLRSEAGRVLPIGYTGNYMADSLPESDEHDLKSLVFSLRPIRVSGWTVIALTPQLLEEPLVPRIEPEGEPS